MLDFKGNEACFEKWYEKIKNFTPKSSLLIIEEVERLVIRARNYDEVLKKDPYMSETKDRPNTNMSENQEIEILNNLTKKIDTMLQGKRKFFRTNVFSPKDVSNCLVSTGKETIKILTESGRFFYDSPKLIGENDLIFVFRDVIDNIEEEFRCFICDGKVIALSQYEDSDVINKKLGSKRIFDIETFDLEKIICYLNNVITTTNIKNAVIDVAKTTFKDFILIEINPFSTVTNKALFANLEIYTGEFNDIKFRYIKEEFIIGEITKKNGVFEQKFYKINDLACKTTSLFDRFLLTGNLFNKENK